MKRHWIIVDHPADPFVPFLWSFPVILVLGCGRTGGCPLLLVVVGGGPSDPAAVCQHVGADRCAAASVGIAQAAAAPKTTIPMSPRNGKVSEETGSGSHRD